MMTLKITLLFSTISCLRDSPCSHCSSVLQSKWEVTASYRCSWLPSGQRYSSQPPTHACTHERARWDARVCQSDSVSHSEFCSQGRIPASISTGSTAAASTFCALANRPGVLQSNSQSCSHVWPGQQLAPAGGSATKKRWNVNHWTWTTFQLLNKCDQIKLQKQQTQFMGCKTTMGARNTSISERRVSVSSVTDERNESDVTDVLKVYQPTPSLWAFSAITAPFLDLIHLLFNSDCSER